MPAAPDARSPVGERPLAPVTEMVAAAPAVPVIETQAPPTPDRSQIFAAATSRCERENALVGFFCKESARLQYCDGHWGEGPLCPSGAPKNNSR
jgi:hypothetical protein